jgi:ribosomal protein S18 acetylase RimI-like enzyme
VRIRPAELEDVAALREIARRAYEGYVERIGRRPAPMDADYAARVGRGEVWAAAEERPVGMLVLVGGPDHVVIENVAVDPSWQGRGIGRALLAFAEDEARRRGIGELRLYTNVLMTENLRLYARLGYREDERRREHGFERVFLSKRVGGIGPPVR